MKSLSQHVSFIFLMLEFFNYTQLSFNQIYDKPKKLYFSSLKDAEVSCL